MFTKDGAMIRTSSTHWSPFSGKLKVVLSGTSSVRVSSLVFYKWSSLLVFGISGLLSLMELMYQLDSSFLV